MYRVEDKFNCSVQEMYQLQRRLSTVMQVDSNEKNIEGYNVASLYFDDLADTCLTDTIDGCEMRNKYRIRIYNNSMRMIKLEVKQKLDNRINKKSKSITEQQLWKLMCGECIEDGNSLEDPATLFNLAIKTGGLRPKIIVTYERKAYLYQLGNVRITFDRNVRVSDQIENFGKPHVCYEWLKDQDAVLEIKYDEFIPAFLLQLLELGNLQQVSYSKYQFCRERCSK